MPLDHRQIVKRSYLSKSLMTISQENELKSTMAKEKAGHRHAYPIFVASPDAGSM